MCIVGAGAAGITLARELAGASRRVLLLESGGFTADAKTQALHQGRLSGLTYYPLTVCRLRYFGGTTNHWDGECRPLNEIDFEAREGVPMSGWPFDRAHLEPHYRRAEAICQVDPGAYAPSDWATREQPELPAGGSALQTHILQLSPPTRFGAVYREDLERAPNITVYTHANVLDLETDPGKRSVTRLVAATLERNTFSVTAKAVVLATGGIENPRLLLLNGLGNGLVGRCFMEHLAVETSRWLPADAELPLGLYKPHEARRGDYRGRVIASLMLPPEVIRQERLPNFRYEVLDRTGKKQHAPKGEQSLRHLAGNLRRGKAPDRFFTHVWNVLSDLGGAAGVVRQKMGGSAPQLITLEHIAEQVPNLDSRVTLTEERDALGRRRVDLAWRLSDVDRDAIRRTQELMARTLGQAELGRLQTVLAEDPAAWPVKGQHHHMGTTRMHADPAQGVVDPNCRVHGMSNLYIAGSSVFPTSSSGTPTLTLVALALRLADHLKEAAA